MTDQREHLSAGVPQQRDTETYTIEAERLGAPVDPPDRTATFADIKARSADRPPIIPAVLRNPEQRRELARWSLGYTAYLIGRHLYNSPKYAAKVAFWSPVGLVKGAARIVRWASAEEGNWHLRQQAANRDDPAAWMALDRVRERQAQFRWLLVIAGLLALVAVIAVLASPLAPGWILPLLAAAGVPVLAWAGRPADRPILDRVSIGPKFTKLTAEMVRAAVVDLGIGVKDPGSIKFNKAPIHADGPGWLAIFDLPGAIVATKVLEKRDGLAGALRLPVDQVWPEVGPDHPGQVALWVGYQPASKMGQPRWALASPSARTSIFEAQPFGTDARQRPVSTVLFERNVLIGGQPGSGKSYAARTLTTIAALDPTCELKIAEFKGTGDFLDMAKLCSTYACGVDDEALSTGRDILVWALAECERRGKRIKRARESGAAPLGKVTPELAAKPGSGLHPVFILLDEVHELFLAYPDAAEAAERVAKRGRALGVILVLATQIADKDSVPPNITRCMVTRWCLSVGGQVENDMILGTGAYKRGLAATVYEPGVDAGWGVIIGNGKSGAVRSFFPRPEVSAAIVARAAHLRGHVVASAEDVQRVQARDMLADARAVLHPGESGLPWAVLAARLAEQWPEMYEGITADMVRESLNRYGVESQDVKPKGSRSNVKGARRSALDAAQQRREIESD